MRSTWPLILALLAVLGAGWFLLSTEEAPGGAEGELSAGPDRDVEPDREKTPKPMEASGAVVLNEVPADLWDFHHEPGTSLVEDAEVLERRVEMPEARERVTGDMVLRGLARALGPENPFYFPDQATLTRFRTTEFAEGFPPGEASVAELLALAPRAGFRFLERDGRLYMLPLPDDE